MQGQLRMLNFACAAKARARTVILTRPSRDEPLEFRLTGGHQRGYGIFVESVNKAQCYCCCYCFDPPGMFEDDFK